MNFEKIELEDVELIKPLISQNKTRLCDNTIGGLFMWRDYFDSHFYIHDDKTLFLRHVVDGKIMFSFPTGEEKQESIIKVEEYCRKRNIPLIFCVVSTDELDFLKSIYKKLRAKTERDWFDYLYEAKKIISLSGRKYSGQRNHINKFKKLYPNYSFNFINGSNLKSVRQFLKRFDNQSNVDDKIGIEEMTKALEVIDNYEAYGLVGGYITVDDRIVAIAVGEIIYDTLFVHIEKANTEFLGAYQMIVNEFAKNMHTPDVKYINREEDVGIEGLRRSKLSYHPIELLEKYTVEIAFQ